MAERIDSSDQAEDLLLQSARKGNLTIAQDVIEASKIGRISLNINCKGTHKSNLGWTPLHLACYFGHIHIVELLLRHLVDVNVVNDEGDTPLHKVSYTGRQEAVLLLLANNAEVLVKNGVGQTAIDVAKTDEIRKILKAAVEADQKKKEVNFLNIAREGDIAAIKQMLSERHKININCTDSSGNTALHCAAYRGREETAVLLLQMGIDSSIKNKYGQLASDLGCNPQMKQILSVQPVRKLQQVVTRFEGALLRKSKFFGWKMVWAVLERGVLSFFNSRADATTGTRRKNYKYLDGANVEPSEQDTAVFFVYFSDDTSQVYSIPFIHKQQIDRQKWVHALEDHIEYSNHYIQQGCVSSDSDEETGPVVPLSTMQDALQTAQAHQALLEKEITTVAATIHGLEKDSKLSATTNGTNSWLNLLVQLNHIMQYSHKMSTSLAHCMALFIQQEEVRTLQLKQEQEKCRMLQDAIQVLAKEHHVLECSLRAASGFSTSQQCPPHIYDDTDCEEFFDAFNGDDATSNSITPTSDDDDDTTLKSDESPTHTESELYESCQTSAATMASKRPSYGRVKLPKPMLSRNDFSVWSILKQCIGKELSKITMPVIFNEPLSLLQRIAEYMEYCHLLQKANESSDPIERIQYVTAFAVSASASNWERIGKPFNPLLGETYELVRDNMGFKLLCEQVSHHPPVSAFHAESPNFVFYGSIYPKLKFWGKSIEVVPEGLCTVELPSHKEVYTWTNVTCCVHNVIVGKWWLEQYGQMEVVCHTSSLKAVVNFKPAGWFARDLHRLEGYIYNKQKTKLRFLYGKWTDYFKSADVATAEEYLKNRKLNSSHQPKSESNTPVTGNTPSGSPAHAPRKMVSKLNSLTRQLTGGSSSATDLPSLGNSTLPDDNNLDVPKSDSTYSLNIPDSVGLWQVFPRPEYSAEYYHFTLFAMALNELHPGQDKIMPNTDCRLRPDIVKLENGELDDAASEKNRLEEKQRDARRARKKKKETWEPMWFRKEKHPHTKTDAWIYTGKYWDRDFSNCPDIF